MPSHDVESELREIAAQVLDLPLLDKLATSERVSRVADAFLGTSKTSADADESGVPTDEAMAIDLLDEESKRFKGAMTWWIAPHNLALNQAALAWNLWTFTILPLFADRRAYDAKNNGIVIRPSWRPFSSTNFRDLDLVLAKKILGQMRTFPTVQETVRRELEWIESKFSIRIPEGIQEKILKDILAVANRRWGVNQLRVKNRLIPLDGSPPKDVA